MRDRLCWFACALVALAGCGDDDAPMTTGDAGAIAAPVTGDWTCLGERGEPSGDTPSTFGALLYDFSSDPHEGVPNLAVEIFPDNRVRPGCDDGCQRVVSDASGNLTGVTATEGTWFAYRAAAGVGSGGTTPFLTIGYNRLAPPSGGTIEIPSITNTTVGFIPMFYLRTRLPGTAIVSGTITDCTGETVENASLRLFQGDEELVPGTGSTDFFVGYFNNQDLPDLYRTETNSNGLFAAANAAVTEAPLRVELWGRLDGDTSARRLACEEMQVFADAVTTITMGPLRNDYAAGSGCAD